MKLKSTLVLLGTIISVAIVHAQTGIQWQTNLGGSGGDSATSIKHTADGGYIVVGQSGSNNINVRSNCILHSSKSCRKRLCV